MSKKKKTTTNQTTSQNNTIDRFSQNLLTTGINNARQITAANPFQSFDGQRTAGLTDAQTGAQAQFQQGIGQGTDLTNQAAQQAQTAGGFTPQQIQAQSFGQADLSQYTNPHQQAVIDATTSELDRSHSINQNDIRGQAARAGAFGDDRHAIQQAEATRNHEDLRARTVANLNSQGFERASNLFQQDANRDLQAQTANNQFGLSGAQLGLQGASLLGQFGQQLSDNNRANASLQNQFGLQEQQTNQAGLDAQYQEFLRAQQDPFQRAQLEAQLAGLTPIITDSSGTSTGLNTESTSNPLGVVGTGLSLFSDRRLKEDIKPLGKRNSHSWYSFRYLWDEPDVRREGVMAQNIAKTNPDAVSWVRGFMAVDYAKLGLA